MPMRILLICILAVFAWFNGLAQQTLLYDSSSVRVRHYAAEKLAAYKNDPRFQYEKILEPPVSLWDRFWMWFWSVIERFFGSPAGSIAFHWIIIPLAVAVIVFFIIKLTGMTDGRLFGKKNRREGLDYTTMNEDIHAIDFNNAIQQAVDEKNFRLAVRLLYLQSLKILTDQGKINWQINKTNLTYWQELGGMPYQEEFFELTRLFEYNWYGNRMATEPEFAGLRQSFNSFNKQL
jgi:hypothetical protein